MSLGTRPDKDGSLTECITFVVMKEQGITDALAADHHFESKLGSSRYSSNA